ncbi:SDR family NAD(P)-dependent oxidoreductase [Paraburkholderia sp. J12]|uniref:SDR family NAD(P)-dependent oxidoreductase n=1 Tax=Paraburkholderia sp. J12 TaxID=2805432 RepID=UPI002ABDF5D2|nr:SDR family NAD(P)-dependent oxidoreductase [Paraburkholderia sp. J12]
MGWKISDLPRQDGRDALVTGGASGIGFQVAKALGKKGARVTILGRDAAKGEQAVTQLRSAGGDYAFEQMDLASLDSIAKFAARWSSRPLHMLMNVAGIMAVPQRTLTADGYEMHMGTNFLGHFALTGRLFPALIAGRARVVTVSALVGRLKMADLDPNDLQGEQKLYSPMNAYARSKLADIMFAVELQRRASAENIGVTSVAVDPGTANTGLQRYVSGAGAAVGTALINVIGYPIDRVAENVLFAAVMDKPTDATLIAPSRFIQRFASPRDVGLPQLARDAATRARLWDIAKRLTGVNFEI